MNKKFEDIITEQGKLVYTNVGDSMYPLIKPRDLLVIEAVKKPLKVGDVPLYKRDSGQYVLHRIVGIDSGEYSTKGDNRTFVEKGVTDKHIIGVLTAIVRNGKTFPVETPEEHTRRISRDLIYLVSCAVNSEAPDKERIEQMDLSEVFRLSTAHMLTSAVAFALEKTIPLPHAFDQSKKKAIRKIALFEIERAKITGEFEKSGIWYLPLKGIVLKNDYPKASMREMTDNDILVDPSRMKDVRAIMEGLGYSCDMYEKYNHDIYSKPPTLEFEIHSSLFFGEYMPLFAEYFADIKSRLKQNGFACRVSDEDFYLYFLSHTYKHYSQGGSGLRSLLDVYVFLRAHPDLDSEYLNAELAKLEITDFEQKMRTLSQKLYTGADLTEPEQIMLDYMVSSGCAGTTENEEYNHMMTILGSDDSTASKRRYLKNRVFLSGEALQKNYPFVAKHKSLYPLLLVFRPIKGAITHPKGIVDEYKRVKKFKKRKNDH
ncbi:MAG: nucleotidyltransferase family protein [Ruminococcus sp.]|nr:nucleotidyltransferase family protein [Ruminococcus sp.]